MQEAHKNTESVAVVQVSESCQQELAEVLKGGPQPKFIWVGIEICLIVKTPVHLSSTNMDANGIQRSMPKLHKSGYGELSAVLKAILREKPLKSGRTVPVRRVRSIVKELRNRGLDVGEGSVRTKLRTMGYFKQSRNVPERFNEKLVDSYFNTEE